MGASLFACFMAGAGWFRRSHSVPEGPERSWPRWLKLAPHGEDVSLGGVSRVVRIPARDAASRGQIIGGLPSSTFFVTSSDTPRRVCCSFALSIVPASFGLRYALWQLYLDRCIYLRLYEKAGKMGDSQGGAWLHVWTDGRLFVHVENMHCPHFSIVEKCENSKRSR